MKHYTPKQWLAIGLALSLWTVETWFLIEAAGWTLTPTVVAIPVATAALAFLPLALEEARGWIMKGAMVLAAVFLAGHVLGSVIERTGAALDTQIAKASATGEARKLLETELEASKRSLSDAERQARKACAKPWTDACTGMERREKAYQARVDQLTAELVDAPVAAPADPVAVRLTAFTAGAVTPAQASLWRPVLLPFGCLIGIWSLLAFGFGGRRPAANDNSPPADVVPVPDIPDLEPNNDTKVVAWAEAWKKKHGRYPELAEAIEHSGLDIAKTTLWRIMHRNGVIAAKAA